MAAALAFLPSDILDKLAQHAQAAAKLRKGASKSVDVVALSIEAVDGGADTKRTYLCRLRRADDVNPPSASVAVTLDSDRWTTQRQWFGTPVKFTALCSRPQGGRGDSPAVQRGAIRLFSVGDSPRVSPAPAGFVAVVELPTRSSNCSPQSMSRCNESRPTQLGRRCLGSTSPRRYAGSSVASRAHPVPSSTPVPQPRLVPWEALKTLPPRSAPSRRCFVWATMEFKPVRATPA